MSASRSHRENISTPPYEHFQDLLALWKKDQSVPVAQEILFFLSNIHDFRLLEKRAEQKGCKPFDFGTAWSNAAQAVIMLIYTKDTKTLSESLSTLKRMLG